MYSMKIVCCAGGLGNQMFQYAFYRYLREKGFRLWFDTSSKLLNERHTGFELCRLFPDIHINTKTDYYLIRRIKHIIFSLCWNNRFSFVGKDNQTDIRERCFNETVFCGYWQQCSYIDNMRTQLLNDFQFIPFDEKNEKTAKQISRINSVSIHIRRGDYLQPENINLSNICTLEYYQSAINLIKNKVDHPEFFIFSDDMEWVKKNLMVDNAQFVDWNHGKNNFRDMQLMSLCKHNIIANSTFSWWGAWLNQNSEKIVIAPSKWSNSQFENDLLIPKQWIKIG